MNVQGYNDEGTQGVRRREQTLCGFRKVGGEGVASADVGRFVRGRKGHC